MDDPGRSWGYPFRPRSRRHRVREQNVASPVAPSPLLTIKDVAARLQCCEKHVTDLLKQHRITVLKVGRLVRIEEEQYAALIEALRVRPPPPHVPRSKWLHRADGPSLSPQASYAKGDGHADRGFQAEAETEAMMGHGGRAMPVRRVLEE